MLLSIQRKKMIKSAVTCYTIQQKNIKENVIQLNRTMLMTF